MTLQYPCAYCKTDRQEAVKKKITGVYGAVMCVVVINASFPVASDSSLKKNCVAWSLASLLELVTC